MLRPPARPRTPRARRLVAGLVAALAASTATACGTGDGAYGVPVTGTCRGFTSHGTLLGDTGLLGRALATWRHEGGAMAQPVPVAPPVGPVCVVDAHRQPGLSAVTLADATHLASYRESDGGLVTLASDVLPAGQPHVLPVLSVGDGRWLLGRGVTRVQVWVGGLGRPPRMTPVPADRAVVDVDAAVNAFAVANPGVLPHLLVLAHADGHLYAATGGPPYAATPDEVLAASLGADDPATAAGWEQVLGLPTGVALLAQAVGFTPEGRQAPQQVDRQLTRVGVTTAGPGTVLVVRQEPDDGSHLAGEVVTVVQPSRGGADAQPVGAVTSPSGSWVGSVWLSAAAAGEPDPRELLVMGESGALGGTVELQVSTGPSGLFAAGPLKVVTGADLTELGTSSSRPAVWVSGRVGRADLLDLTPLR